MSTATTTILITGATDGLGRELALRLAAPGTLLLLHGRDAGRAGEVQRLVRAAGGAAHVLLADLSELREVDRLADEVRSAYDRLDVLVNNAGIGFGAPGAPRQQNRDGVELHFAVNYLAGYHLSNRLLTLLTERPGPTPPPAGERGRIVNVASAGQQPIDFTDPQLTTGYDGITAYRQSKLAQITATFDLADRLGPDGVTVNALHPASFMATTMVRTSGVEPWSTVAEGAEATLRLVTGANGPVTGRYYNGTDETTAHEQAYDPKAREQLRALSDALVSRALG